MDEIDGDKEMKTAELNIKIGDFSVVVTQKDEIEFSEAGTLSIEVLEHIISEAKAFREYRASRLSKQQQPPKIIKEKSSEHKSCTSWVKK